MKIKSIGAVVVFIWVLAIKSAAQTIPWTVISPTTKYHTIDMRNITTNFSGSGGNFAIGAFYDSLGHSVCAGYGVWPSDSLFKIYGNDNLYPTGIGYYDGDAFKFKLWRVDAECEMNIDSIIYISGNNSFLAGGLSEIDSVYAYNNSISYPKGVYCKNESLASPVLTDNSIKVKYTAPAGLAIDSVTGNINLSQSIPGTYLIHFITDACLQQDTLYLTIRPEPVVSLGSDTVICTQEYILDAGSGWTYYNWNVGETTQTIKITTSGTYTVTIQDLNGCTGSDQITVQLGNINADNINYLIKEGNCNAGGQIEIDSFSISGGKWPYTYILKHEGGGSPIYSNWRTIKNLVPGNYSLYVSDSLNCQVLASSGIAIVNPCQPSLLIFDNSGNTGGYFVEFEGSTKIYNKSGLLIKSLNTPNLWDGTNQKGEPVPMGDYLIINGEGDKVMVTVIR